MHWIIMSFPCQAGASSLWFSCCGLMSEVMGTGAVRGQQPVFGAGAGPFRFAPSAGYATYPPAPLGSSGLVCKACGQAFSVFRRKVSVWNSVSQEKVDCWTDLVAFWLFLLKECQVFWRHLWWDKKVFIFYSSSDDSIDLPILSDY